MQFRTVTPDDYASIIAVVDSWWGGRAMAAMLPRLFFEHFRDTCFVAEVDGTLVGFLIGFFSPALPSEAYIHFVGVHPDCRKGGIGRALYERFFQLAREAGRRRVRCVTSPTNTASIGFHRAMGFYAGGGVAECRALPIHKDYDGPGEDRVLLVKEL
jgi:GNAT superfamily N-acetyltransferase